MTDELDVLFEGQRVASLQRHPSGKVSLTYDPRLADTGSSIPLLSVQLPIRAEPYEGEALRAFLDGLLPEERLRDQVASRYRLEVADTFGLLRAVGGDCAGAISFVEVGTAGEQNERIADVAWMTDEGLYRTIDELPLRPFGDDPAEGIRISLAGAQNKLAVVVGDDGRIGLPVGLTPSTHILKPPSSLRTGSGRSAFPYLVENEAFCLRLAQHADLPSPRVTLRLVQDLKVLIIERYDRTRNPVGQIVRVHQEDVCQALGIPPSKKYESDGGPGIETTVQLLRRFSSRPTDALEFLERTAFNVLVGNNDAHGKNTSLLYASSGISLAPLYDVISTVVYARLNERLAMSIGGQSQWDQLTARHWWQQLDAIGFSTIEALRRIAAMPNRLERAWDRTIGDARSEGFEFPMQDDVKEAIQVRASALRELPANIPRGRRRR